MVPRKAGEDSVPTLEVTSIGTVDGSGHYLAHSAVVPQKEHVCTDREQAVVVRSEGEANAGVSSAHEPVSHTMTGSEIEDGFGQNLCEPKTEEDTAVTKVPRRSSGRGVIRYLAYVEANRATILILVIGILLLMVALGLRMGAS